MFHSKAKDLTDCTRAFLEPVNSTHRQSEALRAFFIEKLPGPEVARRFGYTHGSFRVLVHQVRKNPRGPFFLTPAKGSRDVPSASPVREQIIALRKQNLSIYDISRALEKEGIKLSPVAVSQTLKDEGFARLPRRADEERPPGTRPTPADSADVRQLDLSPRQLGTKSGGLFLLLPTLAAVPFDRILSDSQLPGSPRVPAGAAMRSLLALKLFGAARHSHVMSAVLDEGSALFAGLNVIPKRPSLTESSCRIAPASYPALMRHRFDAMGKLGLDRGTSFDLDFHTIPFHGEGALVEKHHVSKRSRRQKGMLAFPAQDAKTRVFCYANGGLRKDEGSDEILRSIDFWKERTGQLPEELIFDSRLTTYANLDELNREGIRFITLRRRSRKLLDEVARTARSAWRRIELKSTLRRARPRRRASRTDRSRCGTTRGRSASSPSRTWDTRSRPCW
jgi:hypothetical protein